jgi:hypothetical protein
MLQPDESIKAAVIQGITPAGMACLVCESVLMQERSGRRYCADYSDADWSDAGRSVRQ